MTPKIFITVPLLTQSTVNTAPTEIVLFSQRNDVRTPLTFRLVGNLRRASQYALFMPLLNEE